MTAPLVVLGALFGSLVGSFLNVVIYRLPRGEPLGLVKKSRSQCPECDALIRWHDNLPLVSYLVLRGRCRHCRWRIPLRYPAVEALTAALFGLAVHRVAVVGLEPPLVAALVLAGFSAVLVAAAVIDLQHKILPDALTLRAGPVVALIGAIAVPSLHGTAVFGHDLAAGGALKPGLASLVVGLAGAAVGAGVVYAIRWLGTAVLKKEAMGLGDVKFMGMAGLLLGPVAVLVALFVAMVAGAVLGLGIWAVTRNREIPFGPFLALGVLGMLFYGDALRHLLFDVYPTWF